MPGMNVGAEAADGGRDDSSPPDSTLMNGHTWPTWATCNMVSARVQHASNLLATCFNCSQLRQVTY